MPKKREWVLTYIEGMGLMALILLVGYLKMHYLLVDITTLLVIVLATPFLVVLVNKLVPPKTRYSVSKTASAMGFLVILFSLEESRGLWWAIFWGMIFYFLFSFILSRINKESLLSRREK